MDSFERLNENDEHVKLILEYSKHWLQGKKLTTFNVMELVTKLIPHTQKVMNEKDGDVIGSTADRRVEILKYIRRNKQKMYGVSFGQTGQKERNADGKLVNINPVVVIMGDTKKHQVSFDTILHEGIHAATQ